MQVNKLETFHLEPRYINIERLFGLLSLMTIITSRNDMYRTSVEMQTEEKKNPRYK